MCICFRLVYKPKRKYAFYWSTDLQNCVLVYCHLYFVLTNTSVAQPLFFFKFCSSVSAKYVYVSVVCFCVSSCMFCVPYVNVYFYCFCCCCCLWYPIQPSFFQSYSSLQVRLHSQNSNLRVTWRRFLPAGLIDVVHTTAGKH